MVVTSIVRDRGRVLGIAVALAVSAALVAAPMALGAGDQVASGKLSLKVTKGFKKALKKNGVHMGPKNFKIKSGPSRIDPTNGTGKVSLKGKLKFRGHGKKVVATKLIAKIGIKGGNVKGRVKGSNKTLFRLRSKTGGAKVDRVGFGASISRVSARLGKQLAKTVNKTLGLHSLVTSRKVAQVKVSRAAEDRGGHRRNRDPGHPARLPAAQRDSRHRRRPEHGRGQAARALHRPGRRRGGDSGRPEQSGASHHC